VLEYEIQTKKLRYAKWSAAFDIINNIFFFVLSKISTDGIVYFVGIFNNDFPTYLQLFDLNHKDHTFREI